MARLKYVGLATGAAGSAVALTLGAPLTNSGTTITFSAALTYANGTLVPTIASPDYLPLTILDANGLFSEIVYLTAYTSNATLGTILRGQEGSTGVTHSTGHKVLHGPTTFDTPRATLYVPPTGVQTIDEFNDDAVDSAWIDVNNPSGGAARVAWLESGEALSASVIGGDASGELHARVRPVGTSLTTGDAIITRVSAMQSDGSSITNNYTMTGLILADGTTYASGNQIITFVYPSWLWFSTHTGYNTSSVAQVGFNGSANIYAGMWLRIVKTGASAWRLDISPNGAQWITSIATLTASQTPTHYGVFVSSWGTSTKAIVSFDCLRRAAGIP